MKIPPLVFRQFLDAQQQHQVGEVESALRIYDSVLKKHPGFRPAQVFRLMALAQLGRGYSEVQEAESLLRASIDELDVSELVSLGIFFKHTARYDAQLTALLKAKELSPDSASVLANLGNYFMHHGDFDRAKEAFQEARVKARDVVALPLNLARIEISQKNFANAEAYLNEADKITPGFVDTLFLRAVIAFRDSDYEETARLGFEVLKKNLAHRDMWRILRNLPAAAINEREHTEATSLLLEKGVSDPEILFCARHIATNGVMWKHLTSLDEAIEHSLTKRPDFAADASTVFSSLHTTLTPPTLRHIAQRAWAQLRTQNQKIPPFIHNPRSPGRRIKLAYLSSDLREHVVARIVTGSLLKHDKSRFELYAYSAGAGEDSDNRSRLSSYFEHWTNVEKLTDVELAQHIHANEIDVLVDLNGITRGTRVSCFIYRPAPIQMTWVGMPGTLGAGDACDYLIADHSIVDATNRDGFDENIIYLPGSSIPVDTPIKIEPSISRADLGLPEDKFLFSVFCNERKYHPAMIKAWAQILHGAPDSIMLFIDNGPSIDEKVIAAFASEGIAKERALFLPSLENKKHLQRLAHCDCALDTWPYGAGGTCVDAIRAGIPMVNLKGPQFHTRNASSVLAGVGLPHLVTGSTQEYIQRALEIYSSSLSRNRDFAGEEMLLTRPTVHDVGILVAHLERAYELAFELFQSGRSPADINLA